jgi:hypothetical protein
MLELLRITTTFSLLIINDTGLLTIGLLMLAKDGTLDRNILSSTLLVYYVRSSLHPR